MGSLGGSSLRNLGMGRTEQQTRGEEENGEGAGLQAKTMPGFLGRRRW